MDWSHLDLIIFGGMLHDVAIELVKWRFGSWFLIRCILGYPPRKTVVIEKYRDTPKQLGEKIK